MPAYMHITHTHTNPEGGEGKDGTMLRKVFAYIYVEDAAGNHMITSKPEALGDLPFQEANEMIKVEVLLWFLITFSF